MITQPTRPPKRGKLMGTIVALILEERDEGERK